MHKLILSLSFIFSLTVKSSAQYHSFSGKVMDSVQKKPVQNAVFALFTPTDSILYRFTRTDADGNFVLKQLKPGKYIIMTTHPYYADILDDMEMKDADQVFTPLHLTSKSKLLQEVIVKSGYPIRIKGDTTIYTADSFQVSANANVEELLKKLPGIQVDKNGKITAMGEEVTKVLVDGEEFFGDDPGMAIKNLRADAVKEVQVFDKKSVQSEFTGIDDGKTQKTINLKLKEDRRTGYFGKMDFSGGLQKSIDNRYNNNLLISSFKGKRKISGFLLTGNIGQDGLNWQDNEKYGNENDNVNISMDEDGNISYQWLGGNTDNEPQVNTVNGFIKNINAGIQYSNKWNDKQTLNFSPKFNSQDYSNTRHIFTQLSLSDSIINQQSDITTRLNRSNFKNSGYFDIKIDSMNSTRLSAKTNIYHSESEEIKESETTGNTGTLKNAENNDLKINNNKIAYYTNFVFKHKFKKPRRTISISTDWNLLNTSGTNFLKSLNQTYTGGLLSSTVHINQQKDNDQLASKTASRLVYTEPLSNYYSLELAWELIYNSGKNSQYTHTFSPVSGKYDQSVDSLTNSFHQSILIIRPALAVNFNRKKVKFRLGTGFGLTHFDLRDITLMNDYVRNYTNFFPAASFTYSYKSQHMLRINYNGFTTQPTITQLQPVRNNNNQYDQVLGNPSLKPSFTNYFGISHNTYNFLKDMFTYQSLNIRIMNNAITNNKIININSDSTITQPVNTNGNVNINLYTGMGFKSKKLNTRFYFGPSLNYSKQVEVLNNIVSYSKTVGINLSVNVNKVKEKKYELQLSDNINYNSNMNSQSKVTNHYLINNLGLDATLYWKKTWSVNSYYEFTSRQTSFQPGSNLNTHLWSAKLQKNFHKDEFTGYLKINDILNQNIGIDRSFYSNTYTEERNDRLKGYWLLGFVWNFKNRDAAVK